MGPPEGTGFALGKLAAIDEILQVMYWRAASTSRRRSRRATCPGGSD
ncbi:MAG: hypothetical protein WKF75_12180 [Singulisphaera sp.]